MADESVVPLVRVAEEDRVAQLTARLADVADRARGQVAAEDLDVAADVAGADDSRERADVRCPR